jgi:hypothetical protein
MAFLQVIAVPYYEKRGLKKDFQWHCRGGAFD